MHGEAMGAQVVLVDENKESVQGKNTNDAAHVVRVRQEIHQQLRV